MDRECSTHGKKMNTHKILVGKPEGETTLKTRCFDTNLYRI
jgi:hypothetical protein